MKLQTIQIIDNTSSEVSIPESYQVTLHRNQDIYIKNWTSSVTNKEESIDSKTCLMRSQLNEKERKYQNSQEFIKQIPSRHLSKLKKKLKYQTPCTFSKIMPARSQSQQWLQKKIKCHTSHYLGESHRFQSCAILRSTATQKKYRQFQTSYSERQIHPMKFQVQEKNERRNQPIYIKVC